jgi:4-hydroxythreonine-4-phosphate dehydrogenase
MRPLALTLGDAAGIGPELCLQLLADPYTAAHTWLYGALHPLQLILHDLQRRHPHLPLPRALDHTTRAALADPQHPWHHAAPDPGVARLIDLTDALPDAHRADLLAARSPTYGRHVPAYASLQLAALEAAIDDTAAHRTAAICTAPWNKALFLHANLPPIGHTEVLGQRLRANPVMMLGGDRLRVALVTTHLPLSQVADRLTTARVVEVARVTHAALRDRWQLPSPRLAVAALNPHAGEDRTMGHEDADLIAPAVAQLRQDGIDADGPWPADTLFARARHGHPWPYDAVLAMYHDQGLIPLKLLHFGDSANITLNLPIVRTSVDHGTAYDIAGHGTADAGSLRYALSLARRLSAR